MKILGISGSPRNEKQSGVYRLVETVLANSGCDYELISLRGKKISGCIACLGCAKDNICKVHDDMTELRQKIVEADGYVFGAPNYYSTFNATFHAFLERWFQFRHRTGDSLWGKVAVAVGVGGTNGQAPADEIEKFLLYNFVETISKVTGQGAASCYSCGYGETCQVGIPVMLYGPEVKISEEMVPDVGKQPELQKAAKSAGELLGYRLRENNNRQKTAQAMQAKLMARFSGAV
ncbi:MAG: flavodoxin family protein [Desulfopila sp.]